MATFSDISLKKNIILSPNSAALSSEPCYFLIELLEITKNERLSTHFLFIAILAKICLGNHFKQFDIYLLAATLTGPVSSFFYFYQRRLYIGQLPFYYRKRRGFIKALFRFVNLIVRSGFIIKLRRGIYFLYLLLNFILFLLKPVFKFFYVFLGQIN